jgi:cytochrome bd-type quinol oxidase subunit 2
LIVEPSDDLRLNEVRKRIEELNRRNTQLLIFLSFGIAAAVLLWSTDLLNALQQDLLLSAMRWWALAILPAVVGILPLKEIRENNRSWYSFLRWFKFVLLWLAIICIIAGTIYFIRSILVVEPADNTQSTMLRFVEKNPGTPEANGT